MNKDNSKLFFLTAVGAALALALYTKQATQVYPPKGPSINRIFNTVYTPAELKPLLSTPAGLSGNLYLGFVRLGAEDSNKLATSLWKVMQETPLGQKEGEEVGAVCVELDGGRNDEVMREYMVGEVPMVVRIHRGILTDDRTTALDEEKLKQWVIETLKKD